MTKGPLLKDTLPDRPLNYAEVKYRGLSPIAGYSDANGWTQLIAILTDRTGHESVYGLDYHPKDGWYSFHDETVFAARDALAERRIKYDFYSDTEEEPDR